jgi:two-component system phosphate regulon sensor histidine kinase PhoR
MGEGVAGRVAQTGEEVFCADPTPLPIRPAEDSRYSTSSFISVPIRLKDRTLGVINVTNKTNRASLDSNDLALLRAVSRFLSLSMEKHGLHVETERLHTHLERTIENLPVGLLTVQGDGEVLTVNSTASRLLGRVKSGSPPGSLFDCFPKPTAHGLAALLDATLRTHSPQEREVDLEGPGGSRRVPLRLTSRPLSAPDDPAGEVAILIEDLSLRREVQDLRRLDELKSNFISMVSHELRTPLTSIRGSDHLLSTYYADGLGETQKNLLRIIRNNTERLISLVNNILDISLLDNHTLHLDHGSMDLRDLASECLQAIQESLVQKRIHLDYAPPTGPILLWGDRRRLGQVLRQVLDNAVKFTPDGGMVSLNIRVDGDQAIVDVMDSGEGIPADVRDRVFDCFFQADTTLTRRTGGTGTGLYLARALTEAHGGSVQTLDSEGWGAHFRIRLPLESSPQSLRHKRD